MRLSCEQNSQIKYFAAISGSIAEGYQCDAKNKNILMINGTSDEFVKWEGGEVKSGANEGVGGMTMPIEKVKATIKHNNKCSPSSIQKFNKTNTDNSFVEKTNFKCHHGAFVSYKVKGGGHTIPGGKADPKKQKMLGNTNMDIIAEQEILYFLKITKTEF